MTVGGTYAKREAGGKRGMLFSTPSSGSIEQSTTKITKSYEEATYRRGIMLMALGEF